MPAFGAVSLTRRDSCDLQLQAVANEVIRTRDATIICGYRGKKTQMAAYLSGRSKKRHPDSKHNKFPSKAIDIGPYPLNWDDTRGICAFAGFVLCTAEKFNIKLRWGGDWDGDGSCVDQNFNDLVHFELID